MSVRYTRADIPKIIEGKTLAANNNWLIQTDVFIADSGPIAFARSPCIFMFVLYQSIDSQLHLRL